MSSLRDAADAWFQFWFDPEDSFTLGIIRLLTGWMLVYNLLVWGSDLQAFFGIHGLQPLQTVLELHAGTPVWSFWFYVPEPWIETAHWTCVAIATLFFLGVFTRATSVLAFLITISYSQRVPVANFGLDQILGMLCLYLAIGPSGASLSVDRWWKSHRARQRGLELPVQRYSSARLAVRLIQMHMCVIYFWAGFAKLKGDSWFTGEAMWTVLANEDYQTMDLTWLAWAPFIPYLVAHVTVIWEMSFCILVWNKKLRPLMLLIGTGMHVGIGAFLGMWTFGLVMTYAYFSFSEPAAWRRRLAWITGEKTTLTEEATTSEQQTADLPLPDLAPSPAAAGVGVSVQVLAAMERIAATSGGEAEAVAAEASDAAPDATPEPETTLQPAVAVAESTIAELPLATEEATDSQQQLSTDFRPPKMNTPMIPCPAVTASGFAKGRSQSADGLENEEFTPNTALLLITLCKNERTTLRRYFRKHDIVCRAATTTENALTLASTIRPVAILVAGTQMQSEELATLLEDLEDISDAPTLALTSERQANRLAALGLPTQTMQYPLSPGEVRRTLGQMLFGEAGVSANSGHQD